MQDKRKAYEKMMDAQLEEWNVQVALLRAKADEAIAEAQIKFHNNFEALQRRQDEAGPKLYELKTAGDEAWEDLKTGEEKVWYADKKAFHSATP